MEKKGRNERREKKRDIEKERRWGGERRGGEGVAAEHRPCDLISSRAPPPPPCTQAGWGGPAFNKLTTDGAIGFR